MAVVDAKARVAAREGKPPKLYLFGVNRSRMEQTARELNAHLDIVNNLNGANLLVTSKNYYRRKPQKIRDAEDANLPVYVLRGNSPQQIRQFLETFSTKREGEKPSDFQSALAEAEDAVEQVSESGEIVELSPQGSYIRRLQHLIAERNNLHSSSKGRDPKRRVRIFKERMR